MEGLEFKSWEIRHDREATRQAYSKIQSGGPECCGCQPCLNFARARAEVYPTEFKEFLELLGIDYTKEAEVYHFGRVSPGWHLYGGCFYFIGTAQKIVNEPDGKVEAKSSERENFQWHLLGTRALAQESFEEHRSLVEVNFKAKVPWVIEGEEPE